MRKKTAHQNFYFVSGLKKHPLLDYKEEPAGGNKQMIQNNTHIEQRDCQLRLPILQNRLDERDRIAVVHME